MGFSWNINPVELFVNPHVPHQSPKVSQTLAFVQDVPVGLTYHVGDKDTPRSNPSVCAYTI